METERTTLDKEERWCKIILAISKGCNYFWQIRERYSRVSINNLSQLVKNDMIKIVGKSRNKYYEVTDKGYEFAKQFNERKNK